MCSFFQHRTGECLLCPRTVVGPADAAEMLLLLLLSLCTCTFSHGMFSPCSKPSPLPSYYKDWKTKGRCFPAILVGRGHSTVLTNEIKADIQRKGILSWIKFFTKGCLLFSCSVWHMAIKPRVQQLSCNSVIARMKTKASRQRRINREKN